MRMTLSVMGALNWKDSSIDLRRAGAHGAPRCAAIATATR
jgi:hypothetical protein